MNICQGQMSRFTRVIKHMFLKCLHINVQLCLSIYIFTLGQNTTVCTDESTNLPNYLYLLMLGQFLHGIGGTTLYSLGFVFIDENVKSTDSPLYQGMYIITY